MADGYAIMSGDDIDVRTVSARETAAMVNYLYIKGYAIEAGTPDEYVREAFNRIAEPADMVVQVVVKRKYLS